MIEIGVYHRIAAVCLSVCLYQSVSQFLSIEKPHLLQ